MKILRKNIYFLVKVNIFLDGFQNLFRIFVTLRKNLAFYVKNCFVVLAPELYSVSWILNVLCSILGFKELVSALV